MSVENLDKIDFISINPDGYVVLTISDHLEWDAKNEHIFTLQEKLNKYLSFIESGELIESYPKAKGRKPMISVVVLHKPNDDAMAFFENARNAIEQAGIGFEFKQKHFNSPP